MSMLVKLRGEESSARAMVTISHDVWIGNELACDGIILLKNPELIGIWSSCSFSFHPAGTPVPADAWNTDNVHGMGNIY